MVIKDFLFRTRKIARSVAHLGHLSRVAGRRGFLNREKKRFLIKIGEKAVELVRAQRIESAELSQWVTQLDKIEALLKTQDYGGAEGVAFTSGRKGPAARGGKNLKVGKKK
jgi:hypothetical protein